MALWWPGSRSADNLLRPEDGEGVSGADNGLPARLPGVGTRDVGGFGDRWSGNGGGGARSDRTGDRPARGRTLAA